VKNKAPRRKTQSRKALLAAVSKRSAGKILTPNEAHLCKAYDIAKARLEHRSEITDSKPSEKECLAEDMRKH